MRKITESEKNILEVAKDLFTSMPYEEVGLRDIAQKAGYDSALVSHYFFSKEKLYNKVFETVFAELSLQTNDTLNIETSFEDNIMNLIEFYFTLFLEKPHLIHFIYSYLHRSGDKTLHIESLNNLYNFEILTEQLYSEYKKGNIELIQPTHFFVNLMALITYPFTIKKLLSQRCNFNNEGFAKFISERKTMVFNIIMNSIKVNKVEEVAKTD